MNKKGIYRRLVLRLSLTAVCAVVMILGPMAKRAEAISSGKLDVGIYDESGANAEGKSLFDVTGMMPGDSVSKTIIIKNDGNLAMKCKPVLTLGTGSGLEDDLKCAVKIKGETVYDGLVSGFDGENCEINGILENDAVSCEITVYLGTDCGNECSGKDVSVNFTVYATQATVETD